MAESKTTYFLCKKRRKTEKLFKIMTEREDVYIWEKEGIGNPN